MFRVLGAWAVLLLSLVTTASAVEMPQRSLAWKAGRLAAQPKTADAVLVVIQHVNGHRFQEALAAIQELSGVETRLRSELALAVAGHLSNDNPQPAMRLARELLDQAIGADGDDLLARRLKNDLDVFQTLDSVVLPWAPNLAGHSWVLSLIHI